MSSLIGNLPYFSSGYSDWQVYTERLDQYFEVNDIDAEKRKALLLTSIDENVYKTLRDVCHPQLPKNKTYDELIELLNKQYVVRTSIFRERVTFYNAKQNKNETIAQWFARIKKLSVDCKFGSDFDSILLDRFISGLRSSGILDRLCEEEETLTLQRAVEIATTKESSGAGDTGNVDDEPESQQSHQQQNVCGKKKQQYRKTKKPTD